MASKERNASGKVLYYEKAASLGVGILGLIAESAPAIALGFLGLVAGFGIEKLLARNEKKG